MSNLITTNEAAKLLGVGPTRIRKLISTGRLLAFLHGGRWFIDRDKATKLQRFPRGAAGHKKYRKRLRKKSANPLDSNVASR